MQRILYVVIAIFLTVMFEGCRNDNSQNLKNIDSLITNNKLDSAILILNTFSSKDLHSESDLAYYCLLKAKAYYIKDIPVNNDSIDIAITYYNHTHNKTRLAMSYYYKGAIEIFYQNKMQQAMQHLKMAEEITLDVGDKRLLHNIYELISFVNSENNAFDISLEYDIKKLNLAKEIGDKEIIAYAYSFIADTYFHLGNKKLAFAYQAKALSLLDFVDDDGKVNFLTNSCKMYLDEKNIDKANEYIKRAIKLAPNAYTYFAIGQIYFENKQYEKAVFYLQKALSSCKMSHLKEDITRQLFSVYLYTGKSKEAINMWNSLQELNNSLINANNNIQNIQYTYNAQLSRRKSMELIGILCFFIVVLAFSCIALYIYHRFKKERTKSKIVQAQLLQFEYKTKLEKLESSKISDKKEIEQLQQKITDTQKGLAEMVSKGNKLYIELENHGNTIMWKPQDFNNYIEYYRVINFVFLANLEESYEKLTNKQYFFLILLDGLHKKECEIEDILGITHTSLRSIKSRINKKRKTKGES